MIPTKTFDPDDVPLYAMGLLSPAETGVVEEHLQHSESAREELGLILGDLATYAHTTEMHSPPALARQRLMKHVAREKKVIPIDRGQAFAASSMQPGYVPAAPPQRSFATRVLPWAGWAIAAGLAMEAGHLYYDRRHLEDTVASQRTQLAQTTSNAEFAQSLLDTVKDPSAQNVTLTTTEAHPTPHGRATYVPDKGSLVFIASNLEPILKYKTYELWIIPADGHDPIPAGTFKPDARGNASVLLPQLPRGIVAKAFGVTIEDEGGSQSPTMPIVLKGVAG